MSAKVYVGMIQQLFSKFETYFELTKYILNKKSLFLNIKRFLFMQKSHFKDLIFQNENVQTIIWSLEQTHFWFLTIFLLEVSSIEAKPLSHDRVLSLAMIIIDLIIHRSEDF